ncbi:prepilin peptidase [Coprothermobacteraceae bacterium]|nr:prepilin peptidase [Coprothermobacteraceae bacterium]
MIVGALLFVVGLIMGSFLNVVIYRLPRGENIVHPPSHCPNCGHRLVALDLVPVLSYVFLGGKCRYCGANISLRYPLVELLTGFLLAATVFAKDVGYIPYATFALFSIPIAFIDIDTMTIPEVLVYPLIALLALYRVLNHQWAFVSSALFLFVIHYLVHHFVPHGFGLGDAVYSLAVGLMVRWPLTLVWFILTYALGTLIGVALIVRKRAGRKSPIPFAPIMFVGTLLALTAGKPILDWYLGLFF